MKHDSRTSNIACLVYTALITGFALQAFLGSTPNDAGMRPRGPQRRGDAHRFYG